MLTNFTNDTKEVLFTVLKETCGAGKKIDLCLYTRGGDTNAVWPIVSLLREFDQDFNVLVPFRCHSAGTLLALGSKQIIMTRISELSPIDPSTGNQFNPIDEQKNPLAISVEDVQQYRNFVMTQLGPKSEEQSANHPEASPLRPFLERLTRVVHPLALGNAHRVHLQIQQLAQKLLGLHGVKEAKAKQAVEALTTRFYSHLHMVNRHELREILGEDHVEFADDELAGLLDDLLRSYEGHFKLRRRFFLAEFLNDKQSEDARLIGGAVESERWSYLYETRAKLSQQSTLPPNVQVQLPPGQPMPIGSRFAAKL